MSSFGQPGPAWAKPEPAREREPHAEANPTQPILEMPTALSALSAGARRALEGTRRPQQLCPPLAAQLGREFARLRRAMQRFRFRTASRRKREMQFRPALLHSNLAVSSVMRADAAPRFEAAPLLV